MQILHAAQQEESWYIVWVLLFYYQLPEDDSILNQVGLLSTEIKYLFEKVPDISVLCPVSGANGDVPGPSYSGRTPAEERAVFEAKEATTNQDKKWTLNKLDVRKHINCCTCKSTRQDFCANKWLVYTTISKICCREQFLFVRIIYVFQRSCSQQYRDAERKFDIRTGIRDHRWRPSSLNITRVQTSINSCLDKMISFKVRIYLEILLLFKLRDMYSFRNTGFVCIGFWTF